MMMAIGYKSGTKQRRLTNALAERDVRDLAGHPVDLKYKTKRFRNALWRLVDSGVIVMTGNLGNVVTYEVKE